MVLPLLTALIGLVAFVVLPAGEPHSKQRGLNIIALTVLLGGIIWTVSVIF